MTVARPARMISSCLMMNSCVRRGFVCCHGVSCMLQPQWHSARGTPICIIIYLSLIEWHACVVAYCLVPGTTTTFEGRCPC